MLQRLLALHGFTGSGEDFPPLPLPTLAPALPGHGEHHALPCTLDALDALLAPQPDGDTVLLGYSMGARLALHLALRRRPGALVLISGSPGLADPAERAARVAQDEALARTAEGMDASSFADLWERTPILASQARIPEALRAPMRARRRAQDPRGLAAALRGLGTGALPPLWDRLGELAMPTLLVHGDEDPKFAALARAMQERLPHATRVGLAGCGHTPHLEDPGRFVATLRDWLGELGAQPR